MSNFGRDSFTNTKKTVSAATTSRKGIRVLTRKVILEEYAQSNNFVQTYILYTLEQGPTARRNHWLRCLMI